MGQEFEPIIGYGEEEARRNDVYIGISRAAELGDGDLVDLIIDTQTPCDLGDIADFLQLCAANSDDPDRMLIFMGSLQRFVSGLDLNQLSQKERKTIDSIALSFYGVDVEDTDKILQWEDDEYLSQEEIAARLEAASESDMGKVVIALCEEALENDNIATLAFAKEMTKKLEGDVRLAVVRVVNLYYFQFACYNLQKAKALLDPTYVEQAIVVVNTNIPDDSERQSMRSAMDKDLAYVAERMLYLIGGSSDALPEEEAARVIKKYASNDLRGVVLLRDLEAKAKKL